jgi:hypothetical protein
VIVVTGTQRSGTSMWMQVLAAAGLPVIGDRFPRRFKGLQAANPAGFYESRLRVGVNWTTNPDPASGVYLHPDDTRHHALKVFVPGLVRTDHAFLHRVIATVRPWREYVASRARLHALEDAAYLAAAPDDGGDMLAERRARRAANPAELEWWREMVALVRDMQTRRYPVHLVTYAHLLADPVDEIRNVLEWIGQGDAAAAAAVVRPELRTQEAPDVASAHLDAEAVAVFDDLYAAIHTERLLDSPLLRRMNALNERLGPTPGEDATPE